MDKRCPKCGITKSADEFWKSVSQRDGLQPYCKGCQSAARKKWGEENREKRSAQRRAYRLRNPETTKAKNARRNLRKYGLTPAGFEALLASQDGRCAICRSLPPDGKRLVIDHDHSCCPGKESCGECVRGLLCTTCNTGIGMLGESVMVLSDAAGYLAAWQMSRTEA